MKLLMISNLINFRSFDNYYCSGCLRVDVERLLIIFSSSLKLQFCCDLRYNDIRIG